MNNIVRSIFGIAFIALVGTGCASDISNISTSKQTREKQQRTNTDKPITAPLDIKENKSNKKSAADDSRTFEYYKSAPDFDLACTTPCSVNDRAFLDAFFIGMRNGVSALKEATGGIMPKRKIEYHAGQDGDCFKNGYGEHPTGYVGYARGKSLICSSDYYWYEKLQGTSEAWNLSSYRTIEHQTLTIHEAVHHIFNDYAAQGLNSPDYAIQESFAKVASLYAVGALSGYDDTNFLGGYTVENPPPKEDNEHRSNFFVYSLNKRFGFKSEHTKKFFQQYSAMNETPTPGNKKVKIILDKILGVDVQKSFSDIYIDAE